MPARPSTYVANYVIYIYRLVYEILVPLSLPFANQHGNTWCYQLTLLSNIAASG